MDGVSDPTAGTRDAAGRRRPQTHKHQQAPASRCCCNNRQRSLDAFHTLLRASSLDLLLKLVVLCRERDGDNGPHPLSSVLSTVATPTSPPSSSPTAPTPPSLSLEHTKKQTGYHGHVWDSRPTRGTRRSRGGGERHLERHLSPRRVPRPVRGGHPAPPLARALQGLELFYRVQPDQARRRCGCWQTRPRPLSLSGRAGVAVAGS